MNPPALRRWFAERVPIPMEELRKPLRNALTQLVLSGLSRGRIKQLVIEELRFLMKGAK